MPLERSKLLFFLNEYLNVSEYDDYCPNGCQVDGIESISNIAFSVSATRESIQEAVRQKADCLVVHHGLFWKSQGARPITGPFYNRIGPLIKHHMSLLAYHLPLDAHLEVGNAASLAQALELKQLASYGLYKKSFLGVKGRFATPILPFDLSKNLEAILQHKIILSSHDQDSPIETLAIITGGASGGWVDCTKENIDAYLTGEITEHDWHDAKESKLHFFAGGHHATEQFGIQNLMLKVQEQFSANGIHCFYIPINNPA